MQISGPFFKISRVFEKRYLECKRLYLNKYFIETYKKIHQNLSWTSLRSVNDILVR